MYKSVDFKEFYGSSAEDLAGKLADCQQELKQKLLQKHESFILFWGEPVHDCSVVEKILEAVPNNVPTIGISTAFSAVDPSAIRTWHALCIISRYVTPHAAFSKIELLDDKKTIDINTSIKHFIDMFSLPAYFNNGKEVSEEYAGFHDIKYRRPAFLLLFLPGMGMVQEIEWPASNKDYLIIEALSRRTSRNLPLFGSSAASSWPPKGKHSSWLAIRTTNGQLQVMQAGLIGLLVQTDLSFGYACKHGFELDRLNTFHIGEVDESWRVSESTALQDSSPPRYHIVKNLISPANLTLDEFVLPVDREPAAAPSSTVKSEYDTLVAYEGENRFPNPVYKWTGDSKAFLRPVRKGGILYHAKVSYETALQSVEDAVNEAKTSGSVRCPEVVLLMSCRGRISLFGENGQTSELKVIQKTLGNRPKGFCVYGDGEICPSRRGINSHWNWSCAAFVLGSDFNKPYASAIKKSLFNKIDQTIAKSSDINRVLKQLLSTTAKLLQTNSCHIRMLSSDGKRLVREDGMGDIFSIVPDEINLSGKSPHQDLVAYNAFKSKNLQVFSKKKYLERVTSFEGWNTPINGQTIKDIVNKVEWWASFPIIEGGECLGVLCIDSYDPDFLATEEFEKHVLELADEIAKVVASPIRTALMRSALERTLENVSRASNPEELAKAIVSDAAFVLGRREAYISLMLPDNPKNPTKLRCIDCNGPEYINKDNIFVLLGNDVQPAEKGICGWVFECGKPCYSDNVSDMDGQDDNPQFKGCIPGIKANYALPIKDPDGEKTTPLGVLNIEAPDGILNQHIHVPTLKTLAGFCAPVIKRYYLEARLWEYLKAFLPLHIYNNLRQKSGEGLYEIAAPEQKILTILYADIRGYTAMSQIVGEQRFLPFVQEYYNMVTLAINQACRTENEKNPGVLDKFMGDGVIALYGYLDDINDIPDDQSNTAEDKEKRKKISRVIECAIEAGLVMAENFNSLANKWLPIWRRQCPEIQSRHKFKIGVGIHTGRPMVGLFRTKDDVCVHLDYTAIGRDVNLAARIGDNADNNSVWISATTWELLRNSGFNQFDISTEPKSLHFKGFGYPMHIFEIRRKLQES